MALTKELVKSKNLIKTIVILAFSLLSACGGGGGGEDAAPAANTSLQIQLLATDGSALAQVDAIRDGNNVATSDSDGRMILSQLPAGKTVALKFIKNGYAHQVYRHETGAANSRADATITMIPRQQAKQFDAAEKVILTGEHGATVSVNGNDFVTASGETVSGSIDLNMTPVDVSTSAGLQAFPGSFAARSETNEQVPVIITYGTTEFNFTQGEQQLQLADGKSVAIELPLYIDKHPDGSDVKPGDAIAMWYLDEDSGIWQQQGEGIVVASAASPTGFALKGEVSHFTWWNADVAPPRTNVRFLVTPSAPLSDLSNIQVRAYAHSSGYYDANILVPLNQFSGLHPVPANRNICFRASISGVDSSGEHHIYSSPDNCQLTVAGQTTDVELVVDTTAEFSISADVATTATVGASISACGTPSRLLVNNYAQPLNFAIQTGSLPQGLSLDANTGYITGSPSAAAVGNSGPITVKATDGLGREATASFSIEVSDALSLSATDPELLMVGAPVNLAGLLNSSGGLAPLNYRISGYGLLLPGLTLNATTGDISGTTLPVNINGSVPALLNKSAIIQVRDQNCAITSATMTFNLQQPPVITGSVPASTEVDSLFEYTLGNNGGVAEQWTISNNPSWLNITAEGMLTGTPGASDLGSYTAIEVTATNNIGHASFPAGQHVFSFDIEVVNGTGGGQSISFADPGPITRSVNAAPFSNIASGGAGSGAITYTSGNPDIATVDAATGEVKPVANGSVTITATKAADAVYAKATASYTLNIQNTAPMIAGFSEIVFSIPRSAAQYSYVPTLLSGENVNWALSGNVPYFLSVNSLTGEISTEIIDQSVSGSYTGITLTASNALGSAQITPITLVIGPDSAPAITTSISNNVYHAMAQRSSSIAFANGGGIASSWTLSGNYPDAASGWLSISDLGPEFDPELQIFPSMDHLGTHQVKIRAENSLGFSEITFELEVTLEIPYLRLRAQKGELSVAWYPITEGTVAVSYNLLVSEQADVTLDNFNDAVADLISGYQPGSAITSVNAGAIDVGKTYYITLQAQYAGLQTRSTTMSLTVAGLHDTGNKYCLNDTGISTANCPSSQYPDQDGDLGLDAVNRVGNPLGYGVEYFSLLDAAKLETQVPSNAECVRDNITGRIWEYTQSQTPISSAGIADYINTVNTNAPCAINNWRLPTTNELLSIINYNVVDNGGNVKHTHYPFQLNCNNGVPPKRYYTGDRTTATGAQSWFVDIRSGVISQLDTDTANNCVVLISDNNTPTFAQRYVDHANGTVTDNHTGLTWKKCAEGYLHNAADNSCTLNDTADTTLFNWQNSLLRAQEVNAGQAQRQNHGHTDWRVPNIKELNSLLRREDQLAAMFDSVMFPGTGTGQYWTGTPVAKTTPADQAWSTGLLDPGSIFTGARIIWEPISTSNAVRLVRGETSRPLSRWYLDQDDDQAIDPTVYIDAATRPVGSYLGVHEHSGYPDCNDNDANIGPWMDEIANDGIDNNCDGVVDEGLNVGGF